MLKKARFLFRQHRATNPHLSLPTPACPVNALPSKAAASKDPKGIPSVGYGEVLSDARTLLAGFLSILLEEVVTEKPSENDRGGA
jgi:hypothetical protein